MDDLLKNLDELKKSLLALQANTDALLRKAPKEEVKKAFSDMSLQELERSLEYFTRFENFELCQAIQELIAEKSK